MKGPLVTLGMPVYAGGEDFRETLQSISQQTYPHIEVLIAVDNGDRESAEIARPFLVDPRFRLHIQAEQLGWDGNTDWTMRHRNGAFYVYHQHDDRVSASYVSDLVAAAERYPKASVLYSQMYVGLTGRMQRNPSLTGAPVERALAHIGRLDALALRGLIRGTALDRTKGLASNEANRFGVEHRLLTELALLGEMRLVEGPTYYKRVHGKNLHLKYFTWEEERRRSAWAWLGAALAEVMVSAGETPAERWRLLLAVLDRFLTVRGGVNWLRKPKRWLYRQDHAVLRALRQGIDLARRGARIDDWVSTHSRHTFCTIDMRDHAGRGDLLVQLMEQLRTFGVDFPALLGMPNDEAARRAAAALGIRAATPVT